MADPDQPRTGRDAGTGVIRAVEAGGVLLIELDDGSQIRVRPTHPAAESDGWPPPLERKAGR